MKIEVVEVVKVVSAGVGDGTTVVFTGKSDVGVKVDVNCTVDVDVDGIGVDVVK